MRRAASALVLVSALSVAAPKRAAPKAGRAPPKPVVQREAGAVTWTGAEFSFLNRGSLDGLSPGTQVMLRRSGKAAGTCTVELVAEHSARCVGANVRPGDVFSLPRVAAPKVEGPPAVLSDAEVLRRGAQVEAAAWHLRDFDGTASRTFGGGRHVAAALSHTTFFNGASERPATHLQRVDAMVDDVEIWKGLRASVDLSVLHFSARPDATRTVYTQTPVLLVRQLELGFRRPDVAFAGGLGRTWLSTGSGALMLDGAHASYRLAGAVEVGAFAGLLPDAARLTPSVSQWSAGGFGRLQLSLGEGASSSLVQVAGRAGYAVRDGLGGRFEAALAGSLWAGPTFDVHGSAEVGYGATQAPGGVDAARLDLGYRPSDRLQLAVSGRYRGVPLSGLTEVGLVSPGLRALHADGFGSYQVVPGVLVGLRGGLASDFVSSFTQARVGPELSLPAVLGGPVSLGLGYVEELGWLRGRSATFSLGVTGGRVFRLMSRTSLFHQQPTPEAAGLRDAEVGSSLMVEVSPWPFLGARVLLMGRQTLGERFVPFGTLSAQIWGAF